jgi:peptidoglycan/xylan/chitin deacetylase (PgdA/CDA1 family)
MLPSHDRYSYRSIEDRPFFRWPNGAGLALYFGLGMEHYAFGEGLTENIVPGIPQPDVLNTSWREYGTRVGAWRILEVFRAYEFPLTVLLNSEVYDHCPGLVEAFHREGHEIAAHGRTNSDTQAHMEEAREADYVRSVRERIMRATRQPPAGWGSPWLAETLVTPDLLQEAGYTYTFDWCMDDQPVWLKTRNGRILSIPCSQEINDSSAIIGRFVSAREFADMIIDQLEEMLQAAERQALVMSVIVHTNIIGEPFRLRQFRRALDAIKSRASRLWLARAGEIAAAVYANPQNVVG